MESVSEKSLTIPHAFVTSPQCRSMPWMTLLTVPIFVAELRGYSQLYDHIADRGLPYFCASVFMFLMFNDCLIYWIHRWIHHPALYKYIHKEHHRWLVPTPWASHAFHPLDGFLQSTPYHIFVFCIPLHKVTYLALFVVVNIWTVSIHDGIYNVPLWLREVREKQRRPAFRSPCPAAVPSVWEAWMRGY